MTIRQNQDGSASIEAYSLSEYSKDVIELFQSGYHLNYDLNEGVPQSFGSFMSVKMYPAESLTIKVIESVKNEGVTVETTPDSGVFEPVEQPVKVDGRRKKN